MTAPDHRDPLARRARALYLDAARALDPTTAARLRDARRRALAQAGPARMLKRVLLPAAAFAMIVAALLMMWPPTRHPVAALPAQTATAARPPADDNALPPDADSADPQLYQNLDFYDWLAANDNGSETTPVNR